MSDEKRVYPKHPDSPKKLVGDPLKPKKFSGGSDSAWPVDADYDDPSPEYLSRFTRGALQGSLKDRNAAQSRFNREFQRGSEEIDAADTRMRRRIEKPFNIQLEGLRNAKPK